MKTKKRIIGRIISTVLIFSMMLSLVTMIEDEATIPANAVDASELSGPVVDVSTHNDGDGYSSEADQHLAKYNYVYFGSYPQREVSGNALTSDITNASYDNNQECIVNGKRYRRLSYEMATTTGTMNEAWLKNGRVIGILSMNQSNGEF